MSLLPATATKSNTTLVLANGLVLAEFDIDRGACVRTYYPKASALNAGGVRRKPFGVNVPAESEYFANHMLPDGAEKLTVGRTVFVVNRPRPRVYSRFSVYAFLCGEDGTWRRSESHAGAVVDEMLMLDLKTATLTVRFKEEIVVDAFPTSEGSVVALPSVPPEVAEVARVVRAAQGQAMSSEGSQPAVGWGGATEAGAQVLPTAVGAGGPSLAAAEFAFLVAHSEGRRPIGLLMPVGQQAKFLTELRMAQTPPSPPPEPLCATEEEAPHAVEAAPEPQTAATTAVEGGWAGAAATAATEAAAALHGDHLGSVKGHSEMPPQPSGEPAEGVPMSPAGDVAAPIAAVGSVDGTMEVAGAPPQKNESSPFPAAASMPVLEPAATPSAGEDTSKTDHPLGVPPPQAATAVAQTRVPVVLPPAEVSESASVSVVSHGGSSGASSPIGRPGGGAGEEGSSEILYGLCAVVSKRDASVRRGGRTKAVALLGPSLAWLEPFFPVLVEAAQYCCDIPGSDADAVQQQSKVLKLCYDAVNAAAGAVSAGMAKTSRLMTEVVRYSTFGGSQDLCMTFHTAPFGTTHRTRIPLSPASHDIVFTRYSLEGLIEAMGPSFLLLVRAIMTEKKIIVLSRMGLPTDVAEAAIALGTLGNLLDPTFIAAKVFPYTSINSVEHFLSIPGYIIGTLNPIFESERAWHWDVLCDLDKRVVVLGEKENGFLGGGGSGSPGAGGRKSGVASTLSFGSGLHIGGGGSIADLDAISPQTAQFFKDLTNSVYHMRALRIPLPERNRRLRLVLEEFMHTAVLITYAQGDPDVNAPLATLREHFMNPVLSSLRARCRLTSLMDDVRGNVLFPGENPALLLCTAALRRAKGLDSTGVLALLQAIASMMDTDEHVRLVLRRMTVATGGLNPVGMQLTHPSQAVRAAAVKILARADKLPEGKAAVAAMNGFLILAYEDISKRVLSS